MARPLGTPKESHGKDWVALVLAVGLTLAVNTITLGILIAAFSRAKATNGVYALSENATQILVSVFGGMIGVLGAYLGYRAGERGAKEHYDALNADPESIGGVTDPGSGPPSGQGAGAPDQDPG